MKLSIFAMGHLKTCRVPPFFQSISSSIKNILSMVLSVDPWPFGDVLWNMVQGGAPPVISCFINPSNYSNTVSTINHSEIGLINQLS